MKILGYVLSLPLCKFGMLLFPNLVFLNVLKIIFPQTTLFRIVFLVNVHETLIP